MGLGSVAAPSADAVPGAAVRGRRVLVGWVGYTNLRDLSAGPLLVERVRRGDAPGTVRCAPYRPSRRSDDEIQGWVAEAVTGLISLDALLAILGRFEALPPRVTVIEVEPRDEDWGPVVSEPVQVALAAVETLVRREVEKWLA